MEPPDAKRPRIQDDGIGYFGEIFTLQFVAFDPQTKKLNPIGDIINPPFVHQIFGDNPTTDGYEDVKIHLNVDELTFFSFLEITNAKTQETVEELRQKFKEFFEYEFCSTLEEFQETLQTTKPLVEAHLSQSIVARTPFRDGELILTLNQLASLHTIVKDLHYRVEPILSFFIDGFQCIDTSDPEWTIIFAFYKNETSFQLVGYTTVYRFYAYPFGSRYRIAQMFVFPFYQNEGIGKSMSEAVQTMVKEQNGEDLSVEDPTEPMLHLTRSLYITQMQNSDWIREMLDTKLGSINSNGDHNSVSCQLSKEELNEIHRQLKIPYKDIHLLWFVFLLLESQGKPDQTAVILQQLETTLKKSLNSDYENKALFQELGPDGQPLDTFMMLKCKNRVGVKRISNILITSPEVCLEDEQQRQQQLEIKLKTILQIVESFQRTELC